MTRRVEREYLAYDTTSVSSYSKCLRQVRYGNNKDHEPLEQINLALLFGQQSRLPFYYRKLAGNMADVKTLRKLLADMNTLGYEKIKVVLDRGFFSAANITRNMQKNKLFKDYTMQEVLGELDMIECFEVPGQKLQLGETTKHQLDLYNKLGVTPPDSLQ